MLALTANNKIVNCSGNGRCNHVLHQEANETVMSFVNRVNEHIEAGVMGIYRKPIERKLSHEQKVRLSGKFRRCEPVEDKLIEGYATLIKTAEDTLHYGEDRQSRDNTVFNYENEHSGKVQDMFIVDKGHHNGEELHVVKNNGIVEVFNIRKLKNNEKSRATKLYARPQQVRRYYQWADLEVPAYLLDIARENQEHGRNNF